MNSNVAQFLQTITPQHYLSRLVGTLANCKVPWLKNWLIDQFIAHYGVNMQDAIETNPHNYANFNSFFTRALKPETRPIATEPKTIISPVDGAISQFGAIQDEMLFQAKGFYYDLTTLLGGSNEHAAQFRNGSFMTLYLAPKDYHRIHMPIAGHLQEMIYVPGRLFSVNNSSTETTPNLFARNERVVCLFQTATGPMAVILVGAMIVASIYTTWAGMITPPGKNPTTWQYREQTIQLAQGAELGHFQLGSTAIVLFAENKTKWLQELQVNGAVRFGQKIGELR